MKKVAAVEESLKNGDQGVLRQNGFGEKRKLDTHRLTRVRVGAAQ